MKIPNSVIAVVSELLGWHETHASLDALFAENGAPGDPPLGNKVLKCSGWLKRINNDGRFDPLVFLGRILEDYMDYEIPKSNFNINEWQANRQRFETALARHGLRYLFGGSIVSAGGGLAAQCLETILREQDLPSVTAEFHRALETVDTDPPAGITAASALLESLFRIYIEDEKLAMPQNQTIKSFWSVVSRHLGLDPAAMPDDDLKKILSGMFSIVDGVGSLRTHAGSAHGGGRNRYRAQSRHARLAINSAHTLATFVLETWEVRARQKQAG
jgi:Abortive infection C-terminus